MASERKILRVHFLPYHNVSHTIPLSNIALLFASRGVHVTIVATHYQSLTFQKSVDRAVALGHQITVHKLKFPSEEVGLPEGIEMFSSTNNFEMAGKVYRGLLMLRQPMEQVIRDQKPDCVVADMHLGWAADLAAELGIPRLVFHGRAFFALCAEDSVLRHEPFKKVESDDEPFVLPGLPDEITMIRTEIPEHMRKRNGYTDLVMKNLEADKRSYGVVLETFNELEKDYAHHYANVLGRKSWAIGPVWYTQRPNLQKTEHECLTWLDTQKPNSVVFASFGSLSSFSSKQLIEIATALELCGHPFIWVVRGREEKGEESDWLPEEFEERIKINNKGLIIKSWAPQVLILEHQAVGGFMTHCGWNSVLECFTIGKPMATWPVSAEHFFNEKLVTRVLKLGVEVGVGTWTQMIEESNLLVGREKIMKALNELMGDGQKAEDRRRRAKELGEIARGAVKEGGSSYNNLTALLDELASLSSSK